MHLHFRKLLFAIWQYSTVQVEKMSMVGGDVAGIATQAASG